MYKFLLIFSLFLISVSSLAQEKLKVSEILFSGNKKTKEKIILNELNIAVGDIISSADLIKIINQNENRLQSIGLFNKAKINIEQQDTSAVVKIELVENWYLYPSPIFELGDRSFNVWWHEQNHDLERINYGLRARHYNLTGNKDPLLVVAQFGYTKKFEGEYSFPYVFDNKNVGFSFSIYYATNKEIPYKTIANRPQFYQHNDEREMLRRFRTSVNVRMRPNVETHHSLSFEYHKNTVDEFVIEELNSDYFIHGNNALQFFMINYDIQYDKRFNYLMPYRGYRLRLNAKKEGLGILREQNSLLLQSVLEFYIPFTKRVDINNLPNRNFGFGSKIIAKTNLIRNQQAFANNTGLGWGSDLVSGYDLYVMDGMDHLLITNHIKKQLVDFNYTLTWPKVVPDQFKNINVKLHLRFNFDFAYINEPYYFETNTLNNRWIYGFGPALDIIIYNSYLFSFEYSYNDLGEQGLFLEVSNAF